MMKNYFYIIFVFVGVLNSCDDTDLDVDAPDCIQNKISAILKGEKTNPPTEVWKWEDEGKIYYYISSDCCDQYNYLFDSNCNQVCAPDGGFTGNGDGNCPEFSGEIVKTLIWKDKRE